MMISVRVRVRVRVRVGTKARAGARNEVTVLTTEELFYQFL